MKNKWKITVTTVAYLGFQKGGAVWGWGCAPYPEKKLFFWCSFLINNRVQKPFSVIVWTAMSISRDTTYCDCLNCYIMRLWFVATYGAIEMCFDWLIDWLITRQCADASKQASLFAQLINKDIILMNNMQAARKAHKAQYCWPPCKKTNSKF